MKSVRADLRRRRPFGSRRQRLISATMVAGDPASSTAASASRESKIIGVKPALVSDSRNITRSGAVSMKSAMRVLTVVSVGAIGVTRGR